MKKTVGEIRGLTLTGATETLLDLHTAFGDLGHAIEALPQASKFGVGFQTLFGERFSSEELEQQIQSAFKYLEVTGSVAKGREEMDRRFNAIAQLTASTGGRDNSISRGSRQASEKDSMEVWRKRQPEWEAEGFLSAEAHEGPARV